MKIMNRMMLAAMVSTSLGLVAMPALADPGDGNGRQFAHFDGGRGMRGGPHGPGRGDGDHDGSPRFQGGPGMGRHGGPMGGPGGPGGSDGPGGAMLIERFDANGDGSITLEEVLEVSAEKVKTFDADGDGALSLEEYKALWTDAMNEQIVRSFQFHDPDGDAKVTLDEYTQSFEKMFARIDRDGDGSFAPGDFGPPGDRPDGPPRKGPGPGGPGQGMGPGGKGGPQMGPGPGGPGAPDDNG
ncbi:MAG: EF-hand domain-containing protein [Bauldia sp.]|nr:EF-hand domain-containing protein [Bauldia sp.]